MTDGVTPGDHRPAGPVIALSQVSKSFGGVAALRDVSFALEAGEIHGLVGENGAGKSTLMKIIAGVHGDYGGEFRLDGRLVHFRSTRDALAAGIGMVHQELSIAPDLSVAENVFLGTEPVGRFGIVQWRRMAKEARRLLAGLGLDIDPNRRIGDLPIGLQQMVEIARVVFSGARILILDEPTSALSPPEVERLFAVLRRLRDDGRSIVFISHFLEDILRVSDTVTVFRNGRSIATTPVAETSKSALIERMIGAGHEEIGESYQGEFRLESRDGSPVVLSTSGLSLGRAYRDVSLEVRKGEVLGIYGFMGCGQIELVRTLFGKLAPDGGRLSMGESAIRLSGTAAARRAGIAFVPESRRAMLFREEPLYKNISVSILEKISRVFLKPARECEIAQEQIEKLQIRPPRADALLGALSGGNQQKVALAKWLSFPPKLLILSEPTRGMDVGAKEDVVKIVRGLRDQGLGIIVASTEPETVLSLADRVMVMKKGVMVREFRNEVISKDRLLEAA
jgi:ribose transport system ATP-binding protein